MIDSHILYAQEEFRWTNAQLLEHVCTFVSETRSTTELIDYLHGLQFQAKLAAIEDDERFKASERFLLEEFPNAEDPSQAIDEFLKTNGCARAMNYLVMAARKHRENPVVAAILIDIKQALLG